MPLLKVMTWNLENLYRVGEAFGPATQQEYQQKLDGLAAVIRRFDPDVLAVQEVGSPAAFGDLLAALTGLPHSLLSTHPDSRGIRVGFLSKFAIEEPQEIIEFAPAGLPRVPGIDSQGNLVDITSLGRGALRIRVSPTPQFPVHFITAHLKSKLLTFISPTGKVTFSPKNEDERARVAGLALLRRTAEAVTLRVKANELLEGNANVALILLGDLNDVVNAATTQIFQGPSGSEIGSPGFDRPDRGDDTRLFNLAPCIPEARRFSRVHAGSKELIDHIFVSQELLPGQPRKLPLADSLVDGGLPSITDDANARRGQPSSDHAPIVATFTL